jgi:hypothetical protein
MWAVAHLFELTAERKFHTIERLSDFITWNLLVLIMLGHSEAVMLSSLKV